MAGTPTTTAVKVAEKRLSGTSATRRNVSRTSRHSSPSALSNTKARSGKHRAKETSNVQRSRKTARSVFNTVGPSGARSTSSYGKKITGDRKILPAKAYSGVLFAEYLAAAILICFGAFTGDKGYAEKMSGVLLRLSALTGIFFVLSLVASGPNSGKFAAAFGGLIDVAVLFDAAKSGVIKTVGDAVKAGSPNSPINSGGAGGGKQPRAETGSYELPSDEQDQHSILGA